MPEEVAKFRSKENATVTEFKNAAEETVFYEVRVDRDDGGKTFLPFSFWDDGKYKICEPDCALPLWGMENIFQGCRVFIHEGTKAAQHCYWMITAGTYDAKDQLKAHPFREFLETGVHVGWCGGAPNPGRSDWEALAIGGATEIIIVADNDAIGKSAARTISKRTGLQAQLLQFTEAFPRGFDLADSFPEEMFRQHEKNRAYVGPRSDELLHPATFATKTVKVENKKRFPLRREMRREWIFVTEPQLFVYKRLPGYIYSKSQFNDLMRRFSDVPNVADLLIAGRVEEVNKLGYRPDRERGVTATPTGTAFNTYTPSLIEPVNGDVSLFLEFMEQLIPDETDRRNTLKWIATLIAKPEIRILYGLLLVSETQSLGKTTLAHQIIAPLVGRHNVSYPNESDVISDFNSWIGCKRLGVIAEISRGIAGKHTIGSRKSSLTKRSPSTKGTEHRSSLTIGSI